MIDLYLIDEVNVKFDGLTESDIDYIITNTKKYVKGYYNTSDFMLKLWDGKVSHFNEEGFTFYYMIQEVVPLLRVLGYDTDSDIEVHDFRETYTKPEKIDDSFLVEHGIQLRWFQADAVNQIIDHEKGIVAVATAGGKTRISHCISKVYDSVGMKSIVITPNNKLVNQTYDEYVSGNMNVCKISEKDSRKKIVEKLETYDHVIGTFKKINNNRDLLEDKKYVLIWDECHILGDVMANLLKNELSECPIRIGLTGSLPKDNQKKEKIFCHIGGDSLINLEARELIDMGYAAKEEIYMIKTNHKKFHQHFDQTKWTWRKEQAYMDNNKDRFYAIVKYLDSLPKENTLVLCRNSIGNMLSTHYGIPFIDKDTSTKNREELYDAFEVSDGEWLFASFGTSATGISINRIFQLVLIDVGKDSISIIQSIGRGLRKDGIVNKVVIHDIYADSKYSLRHANERMSLYKKKKYNFTKAPDNQIIV